MKVYFDTCSIQRPLDSKSQVRVSLEAEAVLGLLSLCESGLFELISSEVLLFEINRNPNLTRREFGLEVLSNAKSFILLNEEIELRARELNKAGIKPLDALHLATAENCQADYFCTCDDKILKLMKSLEGKIRYISDFNPQEAKQLNILIKKFG